MCAGNYRRYLRPETFVMVEVVTLDTVIADQIINEG